MSSVLEALKSTCATFNIEDGYIIASSPLCKYGAIPFKPFYVDITDARPVGYIRKDVEEALKAFTETGTNVDCIVSSQREYMQTLLFEQKSNDVPREIALSRYLDSVLPWLAHKKDQIKKNQLGGEEVQQFSFVPFTKLRGEKYAVFRYINEYTTTQFLVDRCGVEIFGFPATGVHMLAFAMEYDETGNSVPYVYRQIRPTEKPDHTIPRYAGKLDNTCGGALPAKYAGFDGEVEFEFPDVGISREAEEEVGLDLKLEQYTSMRCVKTSYYLLNEDGFLEPDSQYCYLFQGKLDLTPMEGNRIRYDPLSKAIEDACNFEYKPSCVPTLAVTLSSLHKGGKDLYLIPQEDENEIDNILHAESSLPLGEFGVTFFGPQLWP